MIANFFNHIYPAPNPWATKDNPGKLIWQADYERGPACNFAFGEEEDSQKGFFWNNNLVNDTAKEAGYNGSGFDWCCKQKTDGCGQVI